MSGDLSKSDLYEGVKLIVEHSSPFIHLPQQKLFTLFSVSFQYLLFQSTKNPGSYIIRVEDGVLADKLAKKAKDPSTRKFMQSLLIPRKFKYEKSLFYLDYFHLTSWNLTSEIPKEKIKGALIVKNTQTKLLTEVPLDEESTALDFTMGKTQFLSSLLDFVPQTILIAHEENYEKAQQVNFPFIKKEKDKNAQGVTINEDLEWADD